MVGYSWVNLTGLSETEFRQNVDLEDLDAEDPVDGTLENAEVPVSGRGPSVGAALQFKLWVLVLGARYAYTHASDFGLHTVVGDLGLRLGKTVSVYGRLGPGWAFQGGLPAGINTRGFVVEGSTGLEVQLAPAASIGFGFDADLLLLTRTGQIGAARDVAGGDVSLDNLRELDGSAVGFQLRPQLHFTWHL